jgi:hypothetical protein
VLRYLQNFSLGDLDSPGAWISTAISLAILVFGTWMFIDALRRREFFWAVLIAIFGLPAFFYFFMVYRVAGGIGISGFELPGAADRRQIKELQANIHHLDKPHHHLQLADIYFAQGKLTQAEESYRAAYARDPNDDDIRAHLANCLVRRGRPAEALPLLEAVCAKNPKHDYGFTLMTFAEAQDAVGEVGPALATWRQVLAMYGYARARVQCAELLIGQGDTAGARRLLEEVVHDAPFTAKFQRKREAVWLHRAKGLLRSLPR